MTGRQTPTNLPTRDWCQRQHAEALALRIRMFWAAQGLSVNLKVAASTELGDGGCQTPGQVFCIRSDMINGWPVKTTTPNTTVRA